MTGLREEKVYLLRTGIEGDTAPFAAYRDLSCAALAALEPAIPHSGQITIKPNATVLYPAGVRVVTHPGFLAGIADYLLGRGAAPGRLLVADGQSGENPDEGFTWKGAGYAAMAEERGIGLKCLNDEPTRSVAVDDGAVYDSYPIYSDVNRLQPC